MCLFGIVLFAQLTGAPMALGAGHVSAGAADSGLDHVVPMFPAASDGVRQGIVRIVNHSPRSGKVRIEAYDDQGTRYTPVTLAVEANETLHFHSEDLEDGNVAKGLAAGTGPGVGDWWLALTSDLDIEVLSYVTTTGDGFLTSMHDVVPPEVDGAYRVAIFNPGSNADQVSKLRLVNPGGQAAEVTITGVDDRGASPGGDVRVSVPAGAARTLTAQELESGSGLQGALGDGTGNWALRVESVTPVLVMSLLQSPTGHLANLSTAPANFAPGVYTVPLFPTASDPLGRQGMVRVINRSAWAGDVTVTAFDDTDRDFGSVTLSLGANETAHFNSSDLEVGNAVKGMLGSTGAGAGDWRLELSSDLDIEVLSYIRTYNDNFLTAMSDSVPREGNRHRVAVFYPASNIDHSSRLRLVNAGNSLADVTITGIDDGGASSPGRVAVSVPARASRTLTAQELEAGGDGFEGQLGDGSGTWQLVVESEQPVIVMSLLSSPAGHLTNLSTAPAANFAPAQAAAFNDRVSGNRILSADPTNYIDFLADRRFRKTEGADTYEGVFTYNRTGIHLATVALDSDGGETCNYQLAFASRTAGTLSFTCDEGAVGGSSWHLFEPSAAETKEYGPGDTINTLPTGVWFPDVTSGGSFSISGGNAVVQLNNGGYIEEGDYRYTCQSAGGCQITGGVVDSGTIVETSTATMPEDTQPSFAAGSGPGEQTYTVGTAIDTLTLPAASGGDGTLTYSLSPGVPGLTFNATTRQFTGTPTAAGAHVMTYTATDSDGDTASLRFTITMEDGGVSEGHAPQDQDEFDRLVMGKEAGGDDQNKLVFLAAGRLREIDDGTSYDGNYEYINTGANTGTLTYTYDATNNDPDEERTVIELTFTSATSVTIVSRYYEQGNISETVTGSFELVDTNSEGPEDPTSSPDLVVQSPSVSDAGPEPGASITISATVRNQGAGESAATTLRYYRSADATITTGDTEVGTGAVSALAASSGSDESISLTAPATAGTYYYGACVDSVSEETDTGNNCSAAVRVTVGDSPMEIEGFDLASVNPWATGIVFASDRFYVVDLAAAKIFAYQSSGERDTASDIDLDSVNGNATGLAFANGRLFVADWNDAKVYAYQSSGGRDTAFDFDLDSVNGNATGITFANDLFFVVDWQAGKVYAYQSSGARDTAFDFDLDSVNGNATGITFANDLFFVVDSADDKAYAYQSTGERDRASDIDLDSDNGRSSGITFANGRLFVVDSDADTIYAYSAGAAPEPPDTDGDGIGDDMDTDDDNDGVSDTDDAFPLDPGESVDTDGDGTGNNADTDDDNDGVSDADDAFPLDPDRTVDSQSSFAGGSGPGDQSYTAGTAIDTLTLPSASGGDGTLTYSLSPDVPGLTFNAGTRQLTGTPTTAGTYAMTYIATDEDGDTETLSFAIKVEASEGGDSVPGGSDWQLDDGNGVPAGIVFANGRFYVVDRSDQKVYAYTASGERDAAADFDLNPDNSHPDGITYANGRFFVLDRSDDKVYAYSDLGEHVAAADFDLHSNNSLPRGIVFAYGRFFVLDWSDDKVYAYSDLGEHVAADDFDLHADNESPLGMTYANSRFYVADNSDRKVYAYKESGERDAPADLDGFYGSSITHANGRFYKLVTGFVLAYTESGERDQAAGFDLPGDNQHPEWGIVYANGRFFVPDIDGSVYAYAGSGERDAAADFRVHEDNKVGTITYANGRFYVVDGSDQKVYAYTESGRRDTAVEFDLHEDNAAPDGIAYANGRFHIVDREDEKVYAYAGTGERDASVDFLLSERLESVPWRISYANGRFYVTQTRNRVFAYTDSGERDAAADFRLHDDNSSPWGISYADGWFYVLDLGLNKVFAYPDPADQVGGETSYGVGDAIDTLPTGSWFPDVTSGGSFSISGGNAVVQLNNGGYIEEGDYRYTCQSAGGCQITGGVVDSGTIVETSTAPMPEDTQPSFAGGSDPGNQTYTVGTAIDTLTLPAASGGDGTLTYSLSPGVPGLTFNATTRQLTGTPTAAGAHVMTYTATDSDGDTASLRFTITMEDGGVSEGHAPQDQDQFDRLVMGKEAGRDDENKLVFLSAGRLREIDNGTSYDGDYEYVNTGANTGTLTYTYDATNNDPDEEKTVIELTFTSATSVTIVSRYYEQGNISETVTGSFELVDTNSEGPEDPDLVVQSPSVSDANPEPGASITISATVRNQGAGESAATTLRYYRSADATITTGDTEVGTGAVSALAASSGSDESISLTAPSAAGTFYYGACVDSVSEETDTGNNCSTAARVTVGDSPMEIEGFDLASVNSWPTGIVFASDRFYVVDLAAAKIFAYQSSGERDTAFDIDLDSDNGNATGLAFANGRLLVADWNDAKVYAYPSSGARDAASDFDLDSANVRAGGITFANGRFFVVDWQAGKVYAYQSSGERDTASDFDLDSANGNATGITFANDLFFVVDSADDKAYAYQSSGERDRASDIDLDSANGRSSGITFVNGQLFVVDSDADTIYAYSAGTAPDTPDTDGDGIADSVDTDDDNDGVSDTDDAFPLDPDESVDTDGDGTGDNADTDDDNDGVSDTDDAFPLDPDRSVDSQPGFAGGSGPGDQTYTVGTAIDTLPLPAASGGDGTLTYSLSPDVPGLTFNAGTRQLTGTPTTAGTHAMAYTMTDSDGDTASLRFTITVEGGGVSGSPDLVVQPPSVSDAGPEPGASITLTTTVRNQGAGESAATILRYYRSTDTMISTADTEIGTDAASALAAAAISDESIDLTAPSIPGTYYYGACVDSVSGETDTGNNCSSAATVTVTGSESIAPLDAQAFNRLMLGNRLSAESFFLDIVSDGRFVEDGRIPGSYSYASTDLNTGTLNLTYDQGNYGGGCVIELTFASSSSGSLSFTCESGLASQEDWRLSEFGLLPGPGLAPRSGTDTALDAILTDSFEARETRAYDIQFRTKSPRGSWRLGCNTFTNNSSSSVAGRFTAGIGNLQPGTVYQVRYRYRNSSSCSSGSPDEWSDIREGRTSGEVTLGFPDGESTSRSVPENSPAGINVGIPVAAVSVDTVSYSLSGPDAGSFAIDSETGQIRTTEGVIYDFESKSRYTVTVSAEGGNGESDTISVTILLEDVVPSCTPLSDIRIANANQRLTVRWNPPTETSGQAPLIGYETEVRRGDNGTWGQRRTILGRSTGATIYGDLVNGIEYQIRVRPINGEGDCEWSIPVSGIPTGEHAPKDADELIDRFDTHPVGSLGRNWRFLTSERCRHHRNGVTLDADCMYQNTGPDTGRIFLEFDDPSQGSCEITLAYSSLTAGSFIDECFDAGVNTNVPFDRSFRMPPLGPPPEGEIDVPRAPRTTEEFEVLAWGRDDFIPGLFFGCPPVFIDCERPLGLGQGFRIQRDPDTGVTRRTTGNYTYENTGPSQGVLTFQADDGASYTFTLDFEPSGSMRVTISDTSGADSEWPGLLGFGAQPILLPIPPSWPAAIAVENDFAPDDWEGLEYDHSTASDDPGAYGGIARALFGGLYRRVFDRGNDQGISSSANYEKLGRNRAVVTYEFWDYSEGFFRYQYENFDDFGKELNGSTWTYELRFTSDGAAEFTLTITKDGHLPTVVEGVADFRGDGIDISEFPDELLLPDDPPQASGEDRSGIEIAAAVSTSGIGPYDVQPFLVNNSGAQPISYSPGDWLEPKDGSNQRMMIVAAGPVSASGPAARTRVASPQLFRQTSRARALASQQGPTPIAAAIASFAGEAGMPDQYNSDSTITELSVVCMQQIGDIPKRGGRYFSQPKTAQGAVQECQRSCVLDEALSIQRCVWNCERTTGESAFASIATQGLDVASIGEVIGGFKGQELPGERPGVPAIIGRPGGPSQSTEIDIDSDSTYFR